MNGVRSFSQFLVQPISRSFRAIRLAVFCLVLAVLVLPAPTKADESTPIADVTEVTETAISVETPEVTVEPTDASPTETPSPAVDLLSPTPAPELRYQIAPHPSCAITPGQADAVVSAGTFDFHCTDLVDLSAGGLPAANLSLRWTVRAGIDAGWSVQLLPPATDGAVSMWSDSGQAEASLEFPYVTAIADSSAGAVAASVEIAFDLRITRPRCSTAQPTLQLEREIAVESSEIPAIPLEGDNQSPLVIVPTLAAIPEPSISFAGPLTFGVVDVTAAGVSSSVQRGTLSIAISDLDRACGDWMVRLSASPLRDANGTLLADAQLIVRGIDGDECDLATGCDLPALSARAESESVISLVLDVELRMPNQPGLGSFQTSLSAALIPLVDG